jgi:hypothetical protein
MNVNEASLRLQAIHLFFDLEKNQKENMIDAGTDDKDNAALTHERLFQILGETCYRMILQNKFITSISSMVRVSRCKVEVRCKVCLKSQSIFLLEFEKGDSEVSCDCETVC